MPPEAAAGGLDGGDAVAVAQYFATRGAPQRRTLLVVASDQQHLAAGGTPQHRQIGRDEGLAAAPPLIPPPRT